ncbi:hypothetical protein BDZ97DRAFT_1650125, partial [Flammula alnicola]
FNGMPIIYANPVFYVFLATLTAFILLYAAHDPLIPLVSTFSFLRSNQANGVSFGMWGWCLDDGTICSPMQFGFTWPPEITIPITKAFVFYPIAIILTFFTLIAMIPIMCVRNAQNDKVFDFLAWISFASSALAFLFTIGIFGVAKSRFEKRGFSASYGNLPWMSLVATLLLLLVSLSPIFLGPSLKKTSRTSTKGRSDIESRGSSKRKERVAVYAVQEK